MPMDAFVRPTRRIGRLAAASVLVAAVACASGEEHTPSSVPPTMSPPINSVSTCIEASEGSLPYSLCLPNTWRVGEILHSDGSMDIAMIDETGEAFGFGKASGPVRPSGHLNRFVPFPDRLIGTQERRRYLAEFGIRTERCTRPVRRSDPR
jgi:hypothetical protein